MPWQGVNERDRQWLIELLKTRSYEKKKVTLASGKESDFFIDCKQTVLTAEGHVLVGSLMFDAIERLFPSCEAVAGVELGGCPLASAVSVLSFERGKPLAALYVRKEAKDHGSKRLVENDKSLREGIPVVVLEDVITTGGSTLKSVEKLKAVGATVLGVIAIVDRQEGGAETIKAAGLPFVAITNKADIVD
ncbi:MAG: orotate phosphoribosyltransferase [Polyangiaceae bacterium]|nr:orotate phosphoribosyltransferase [Polyangiaceae bacterium]